MNQQIKTAMAKAKSLGADFADIRFKNILTENIRVENSQVVSASTEKSQGYGIRVYVDGAMGFAASSDLDNMETTVQQAYDIAKASQILLAEKAELDTKEAVTATYETPVETDPFTVPFADKLALMMTCEQNMQATDGVSRTYVNFTFRKDDVIFADTDGSFIDQKFCQCDISL
ncbi:MAG: hypothetical protein FWG38_04020, partial [Defluviitaleaceae bacterium]|nr:hypothetical protein [Defluviitaleaceae bacterium]